MCTEIDFLTADVRIVLLVLTPSLIFPFFPGSTNNDHGKLRRIKAQPRRPSSSPCRVGEEHWLLKKDAGRREPDSAKGQEEEKEREN